MYKIIFCLLVLCCQCHAQMCSWSPIPEACKPLPLIPENYELIDLGETTIPAEQLQRFALPQTYAPRINNAGTVVYNNEKHACVRQPGAGEIFTRNNGGIVQCFGVNDRGDLLIALDRSHQKVNWALWKMEQLRKVGEISISGEGLPGDNMYLRALNNQGTAVGALRPAGKLRPLFWSTSAGLHHLGFFFGWDLEGIAWDVNDQNTVVGTVYPPNCDPQIFIPFAWNEKWGLERLTDYRSQICFQLRRPLKETSIQFGNPVIDQDDVVYGQVVVDEKIYHFMWYPRSHEIRLSNRGDLKLNAVNKNYIFAGSLDNKAAIYQRHLDPVLLSELIGDLPLGWELLEASDINDTGAVVGFGTLNGTVHLFQAIPAAAKIKMEPPPQPEVKLEPKPVVKEPILKFIFEEALPDSKGTQ